MKAARWYARGDVRYEDVPEPFPGPRQVKVRIHYTGICGSDLHEYQSGPVLVPVTPHPITGCMAPLILGHEFSGKVVELGEGVDEFEVGDRVTGDCIQGCGKCYYCMRNKPNLCRSLVTTGLYVHGSFAEYFVGPVDIFYKIPDAVSDEIAALMEPLEVAFHAVRQGRLQLGDSVAIVGAGAIGCGVVLAAKAAGASKIYVSEYSNKRRETALEMGATAVINPANSNALEIIQDLTNGLGADVTFDCAGNQDSIMLATSFARWGGISVIVGIYHEASLVSSIDVTLGEKTIVGSAGEIHEASFILEMIANGTIDPSKLITGRIELKDIVDKGFRELLENKDEHLKILVESPNWS